jgi:hypothetical protein
VRRSSTTGSANSCSHSSARPPWCSTAAAELRIPGGQAPGVGERRPERRPTPLEGHERRVVTREQEPALPVSASVSACSTGSVGVDEGDVPLEQLLHHPVDGGSSRHAGEGRPEEEREHHQERPVEAGAERGRCPVVGGDVHARP